MARTKTTPIDPALVLERVALGIDYFAVTLHGVRIGDVRGTESGPPGLPAGRSIQHQTRNDAANAVLREYLRGPWPVSCRWCREEQTNYLLGQNHGESYGIHSGMCMAQSLTRNHVIYSCYRLGYDVAPHKLGKPERVSAKTREYEVAHLERALSRVAVLWGHRDDVDWLHAAREVLAREKAPAPAHAPVLVADDEMALW